MQARQPSSVLPLPLEVMLSVVNEWADDTHAFGRTGYPDLADFQARMSDRWPPFGTPAKPALIQVANLVRPAFTAATPDETALAVNQLIERAGLRISVEASGSDVVESWHTRDPRHALLAAATLTVIDVLRHDPDWRRLGTCTVDDCADIFVDQSPAGRRRYCSITCQNRARARSFRARRAEA